METGTSIGAPVRVMGGPSVVQDHFRGGRFHAQIFLDSVTPEYFDQVIAKRRRAARGHIIWSSMEVANAL